MRSFFSWSGLRPETIYVPHYTCYVDRHFRACMCSYCSMFISDLLVGIQWTKGTHSCQQGSSVQLRCYFQNQENPDKIDMVGGQACTILMKSIIEENRQRSMPINPLISVIDHQLMSGNFVAFHWYLLISNVNRLIHCHWLILISHLWIWNILARFGGFTNLEQMPTNFLQWRCQQDSHATYFQQNILLC